MKETKNGDVKGKRRSKQSTVVSRYLAAIDRDSSRPLQRLKQNIITSEKARNLTLSPRSRSSYGRSVKTSKTSVTSSLFDQSVGSLSVEGSWTVASPSRLVNSSQDLTTPGSLRNAEQTPKSNKRVWPPVSQVSDQYLRSIERYRPNNNSKHQTIIVHEDGSAKSSPHRVCDCTDDSSLSSPRTPESPRPTNAQFFVKTPTTINRGKLDRVAVSCDSSVSSSDQKSFTSDSPKTSRSGFLEKSFDLAVENSLDLILDQTAWANCNASPISIQCSPIDKPSRKRRLNFNSKTTKSDNNADLTEVTSPTTTPTSTSSRDHRSFSWKLSQSLSSSSMFTEAATEVATNRAIDLAMKRIREIERDGLNSLALHEARNANLKASNFANPVVTYNRSAERHAMGMKSLLSISSNESSRKDLTESNLDDTRRYDRLGCYVDQRNQQHSSLRLLGDDTSALSRSKGSSLGVEFAGLQIQGRAANTIVRRKESIISQPRPESRQGQGEENNIFANGNLLIPDLGHNEGDEILNKQSDLKLDLSTPKTKPFRVVTPTFDVPTSPYVVDSPCISPPKIIRQSQSFEEKSPDPIFCTFSSSMHSSTAGLLNSSSQAGSSVSRSFGSDDAMFMVEGSITGEQIAPQNRSDNPFEFWSNRKIVNSLSNSSQFVAEPIQIAQNNSSGENRVTLSEPDYSRMMNQPSSLPTAPNTIKLDVKLPSQLLSYSAELKMHRILTIPPPPPPLPPPHLNIPSHISTAPVQRGITGSNRQASTLVFAGGANRVGPKGTSAQAIDFKSLPNTSFSTKVPSASKINTSFKAQIPEGTRFEKGHECVTFKSNLSSPLRVHLARSKHSKSPEIPDLRSVDVQSLRSAYESRNTSPPADDDEDDDTDCASVRSLKERFEPQQNPTEPENAIAKLRSLFEVKKAISSKKSQGTRLHDVRSKFEAPNLSKDKQTSVRKPTNTIAMGSIRKANNNLTIGQVPHLSIQANGRSWRHGESNQSGNSFGGRKTSDRVPTTAEKVPKVNIRSTNSDETKNHNVNNFPGRGAPLDVEPVRNEKPSANLDHFQNMIDEDSDSVTVNTSDKGSSVIIEQVSKTIATNVDSKHISLQDRIKIFSALKPHEGDKSNVPSDIRNSKLVSASSSRIIGFWSQARKEPSKTAEKRHQCSLSSKHIEQQPSMEETRKFASEETEDPLRIDAPPKKQSVQHDEFHETASKKLIDTTADYLITSRSNLKTKFIKAPAACIKANVQIDKKTGTIEILNRSSNTEPTMDLHKNEVKPEARSATVLSTDAPMKVSNPGTDFTNERCTIQATFGESKTSVSPGNESQQNITKNDEGKPEFIDNESSLRNSTKLYHQETHEQSQKPSMNLYSLSSSNEFEMKKTHEKIASIQPYVLSSSTFRQPADRKTTLPTSVAGYPLPQPLQVSTTTSKSDSGNMWINRNIQSFYGSNHVQNIDSTRLLMTQAHPADVNQIQNEIVSNLRESKKSFHDRQDDIRTQQKRNDVENDSDTEFSDGVTLDVSIAEVSNLTNPTAIWSKGCDRSVSTNGDDYFGDPRSIDLNESEAKRSEASSSQTSEAAHPLLAKALRLRPMSDECSNESFFRTRSLIARHWANSSSLDLKKSENQLTNASDNLDEKLEDKDPFEGWDVARIESTFPFLTDPKRNEKPDFATDWNPFAIAPVVPNRVDSGLQSRVVDNEPLEGTLTTKQTNSDIQQLPKDQIRQNSESVPRLISKEKRRFSEATARLASNGEKQNGSVSASVAAEHRISQEFKRKGSKSAISSSTTGNDTSKISRPSEPSKDNQLSSGHALLMARLKKLKASRMRRAAAIYGSKTAQFSCESRSRTEEDSSLFSGGSSTRFGGSSFMASLDLD